MKTDMAIMGMFLKTMVETVRKQKGPSGIEALRSELGSVNYYGMRDYPLEEEVKLQNAAMKILYGGVSNENYRQLGGLNFHTFTSSPIGKTMLSLFKNDIKKLALSIKIVLGTISKGFIVEVEDLGPKSVKITIYNLPYPIEYYEGIFLSAIDYFKDVGSIKRGAVGVKTLNSSDFAYTLSWE